MITVWKFPLEFKALNDVFMPLGSEILTIQIQNGNPTIWAEVDTDLDTVEMRTFGIVGTGHEIKTLPEHREYVGTIFTDGSVWHIFEIVVETGGKLTL